MDIQSRLADRAQGKAPSPIRELARYMKNEGMISLGGGYPNPDTFVFSQVDIEFKNSQKISIGGADVKAASQYSPTDTHGNLKAELIRWHKFKDDVALNDDQLIVLNGCQEGLFIMAYLFLNADDYVVVSEPTYPGTIAAFSSFSKNFISIPLDSQGMNTSILEQTLTRRKFDGQSLPKFIYCIPNGHNPGGVALSDERRNHLIEIANTFDLLILEDDPYQLVKLDDSPLPPTLQSLDSDGRVIRLDSFSKIFAPGLRFGYASGPADIIRQFVLFKQSANLHTSSFIQMVIYKFLQVSGLSSFREHIRNNCRFYRNNRDAMIAAAQKYLPPDVSYDVPQEGMFIWFRLPENCDAERMINSYCADLKVLLIPGRAFSTNNGCRNCMRASFSLVGPQQIKEGIKRFAEMIRLEQKAGK